jgi:hypothetical protein
MMAASPDAPLTAELTPTRRASRATAPEATALLRALGRPVVSRDRRSSAVTCQIRWKPGESSGLSGRAQGRRVMVASTASSAEPSSSRPPWRARRTVSQQPPSAPAASTEERVLCPYVRWDERVIRTVSVAATFGQPLDVTLDALRVKPFFPLDAEAEEAMRQFVQTL